MPISNVNAKVIMVWEMITPNGLLTIKILQGKIKSSTVKPVQEVHHVKSTPTLISTNVK